MIAYYYNSSASGFPDEKETVLAPNSGDVIKFPFTFTLTPTENRIYYISLKADEKTEGMPTIFGGIESDTKKVIVTKDKTDISFILK